MIAKDAKHAANWGQGFVWSVMVCLIIIAGLLMLHVYNTINRPPPFQFAQKIVLPKTANICPGDTVQWTTRLTVNRTPTVILFARTLWDSNTQNTLISDTEVDYFVWTEAVQGEPIIRPNYYKLPEKLPVGMYEIRVGAASMNSDAATYAVPFVIAESCFKGGVK